MSSSAEFAAWLRRCQRRARAHTRNASMGMDPLMTSEHRAERCRAHSSGRRASESSSSMHCYAVLCSAMGCFAFLLFGAAFRGAEEAKLGASWLGLRRDQAWRCGASLTRPFCPFTRSLNPFADLEPGQL